MNLVFFKRFKLDMKYFLVKSKLDSVAPLDVDPPRATGTLQQKKALNWTSSKTG